MGGFVLAAPLVGVQFAVPRLVLAFENATEPVGPTPLLFVVIYAVSVTFAPAEIEVALLPKTVEVLACVMVTESVLLVLAAKFVFPDAGVKLAARLWLPTPNWIG